MVTTLVSLLTWAQIPVASKATGTGPSKLKKSGKVKPIAKRTASNEGDLIAVPITPAKVEEGFRPSLPWAAAFEQIQQQNKAGSEAYKQLSALIKATGHRLTGSPQGKAATQFVKTAVIGFSNSQTARPNLSVDLQPFMVQAWSRGEVSLDVVPFKSDNYAPIACVSLAQTPAISNISAQIVYCGNGLPEDWTRLGASAKGKVALFTIPASASPYSPKPSPNLHRSEKIALAIKAGVVACILINGAPGDILLTGTASATGAVINIPAVAISQNSGTTLLTWLAGENLMADLKVLNKIEPQEVHNVIATVKGTDLAAEEIVVGCHLDSWDLAQGACDNGAGSAAVLEMARLLAMPNLRPRRTIKFVWFVGEEQGLLGSQHYVRKLGAGIKRTKYMVNLDMAYNSSGFNAYGRPEAAAFFDSVGRQLATLDTSYHQKLANKAGLHSDHQSFMLEGIPVASPDARWSAEALHCYHADCDRLNWINPEGLDRTARITACLVYALATTDQLPATQLNPAQTKAFLIRNGLEEALRLRGEWK